MYTIIVLQKGDIRDDHLIPITENKKYNVPFADLCN